MEGIRQFVCESRREELRIEIPEGYAMWDQYEGLVLDGERLEGVRQRDGTPANPAGRIKGFFQAKPAGRIKGGFWAHLRYRAGKAPAGRGGARQREARFS
ncbi:hypothetical protein AK812_SmicGene43800 [Symbiodinium microadriaticum]|uniref:Uncharacterized protein n=1 Tax=Symbiodinium microadriaticum TaxID=2951 RepID=A0A1Q9C029_SYMMI|nr:hypothetical protein AK812_SmicGene43800 [Symbiodinium microadriaticum]